MTPLEDLAAVAMPKQSDPSLVGLLPFVLTLHPSAFILSLPLPPFDPIKRFDLPRLTEIIVNGSTGPKERSCDRGHVAFRVRSECVRSKLERTKPQ